MEIPTQLTVEITNTDYFFMIENQVRTAMKNMESTLGIAAATRIIKKAGVEISSLKEYPAEGYYYETETLRLYLKILRNLQHNKDVYEKVVDDEDLKFLKRICDNDLFGIEDPSNRNPDALLKRRYDILTLTMEDETSFNPNESYPWSIDEIMKCLGKKYGNRTNLVELAYLIGNPKCLCCGAETNSAYRMFAWITGSCSMNASWNPIVYVWNVGTEVEALGKRIVDAYNQLLQKEIIHPTLVNHLDLNKSPKLPRATILGYVDSTRNYYHWILNDVNVLTDVYSPTIITTESLIQKVDSKFKGNIFNGSSAV